MLTDAEWKKACYQDEEVGESSFYDAKKKLLELGYVEQEGKAFSYAES